MTNTMQTYTNPAFPNKVFRRLEVGEVIQEGDYLQMSEGDRWHQCDATIGMSTQPDDFWTYYRPLEEGETFATSETLTTDQRLDIILAKLERIDAVLAGLNAK